jgi:hypothetical protein
MIRNQLQLYVQRALASSLEQVSLVEDSEQGNQELKPEYELNAIVMVDADCLHQ